MKKIILGLFLTVGISSMALAENNLELSKAKSETIITKNEQGSADKKQVITYRYVNGVLFSCTIAIHTQIKDNCGNTIGTRKESYEASGGACNGIEGGLAIYRKTEHLQSGNCGSLINKIENLFD